VRDASFGSVLDALLAQLGGGGKVGYTIENDIIMIGEKTPASAAGFVVVPDAPAAANVLARRLPEANFNATSLDDAVNFLRDVAGAKIEVNWAALGRAGVTRKTPVTLRVRDVPLATVLTLMLASAPTKPAAPPLDYTVDAKGVITITVATELRPRPATAPARR
jgi:hypothetical protein